MVISSWLEQVMPWQPHTYVHDKLSTAFAEKTVAATLTCTPHKDELRFWCSCQCHLFGNDMLVLRYPPISRGGWHIYGCYCGMDPYVYLIINTLHMKNECIFRGGSFSIVKFFLENSSDGRLFKNVKRFLLYIRHTRVLHEESASSESSKALLPTILSSI